MDLTIVTYGGGEILYNIFNAIAMLLSIEHGGYLKPLVIIISSIGLIYAVVRACIASSAQQFFLHYILPLIAVVGLFMVPSTPVHIEDILKDQSYKVDHVPLLLGKFAELASSIGYQVTKAVEKVMHVPNDISYNSTGMIFGADTAMDISRYQITNANLERNLKLFCKQCALYDISLGRYTIDDMKKTTDLWKFFEDNTSKVRMMRYLPIETDKKGELGEYLTCKEAISKMKPYFEKEKGYYGQLDVCRHLPCTFQALTGMQQNGEDLISQQLMMNVLLDEYSGNGFAKGRAHLQQRNTYQILGALASSSLITLRAVIEALIYATFIFVLPLAVFPGGFKFINTWLGLVVWIQLWPPFYAILNYIMQSVAHGYANSIFTGLAGAHQGLSLFSSFGLHNLQQDIYALSGYLAASIPFLTYAILKGGVGSFVHLASSMMTPAHTAATTAAAEQTAGNYSFGNVSYGQTSYRNTTGLHTNMAPSLTGGFFQENTGTSSVTYGQNEQILRQSNSDLRTSLFSDDSISQTLQKAQMHSRSSAETASQNYQESVASVERNAADMVNHCAKSESFSHGYSEREAHDLQESARYFQNVAENWGKQAGLNSRQSVEHLAGLGLNFVGKLSSSTAMGSTEDHHLSSANNLVKSEEFQKHFQHLVDYSETKAYNSSDEQGLRIVESYNQSLDQAKSSQDAYQLAQSQLNQVSENASWAEQNSHLIRRSLNQDFINWASDQYRDQGGFSKVEDILMKGSSAEQENLVTSFVDHVRERSPQLESPKNYVSPDAKVPFSHHLISENIQSRMHQTFSEQANQLSSQIPTRGEALRNRYSEIGETNQENFQNVSSKIENTRRAAIEDFQSESDRSLFGKSLDKAASLEEVHPLLAKLLQKVPREESAIANNFQITEEAFWMKRGEKR